MGSEIQKMKLQKIIGNSVTYYKALKIAQEWLPRILSLPQVIENSRQFVLLRTDISQKIVVGCS